MDFQDFLDTAFFVTNQVLELNLFKNVRQKVRKFVSKNLMPLIWNKESVWPREIPSKFWNCYWLLYWLNLKFSTRFKPPITKLYQSTIILKLINNHSSIRTWSKSEKLFREISFYCCLALKTCMEHGKYCCLALKNLYGTPPRMAFSGWLKPELGVTVPPLPSELSGTI